MAGSGLGALLLVVVVTLAGISKQQPHLLEDYARRVIDFLGQFLGR